MSHRIHVLVNLSGEANDKHSTVKINTIASPENSAVATLQLHNNKQI